MQILGAPSQNQKSRNLIFGNEAARLSIVRHQGLEPRTHCLTSKDSRRAVTLINELPNPAPKDGNGGDKKAA